MLLYKDDKLVMCRCEKHFKFKLFYMVLTTIFQTVYPEPLYLHTVLTFFQFNLTIQSKEKKIVKSKKNVDFLFIFLVVRLSIREIEPKIQDSFYNFIPEF